jgi:hypothetical protein
MHPLEGEAHFDFFSAQAARGFLCERMARQHCSLDQTAHFLIAAWNPGRPWPKQVGTHSRKCLLTRAPDHAPASGETTSLYESRSNPPCALSKGGSSMETSSRHRPGRRPCCGSIVKHFASIGSTSQRRILQAPVFLVCLRLFSGRARRTSLLFPLSSFTC